RRPVDEVDGGEVDLDAAAERERAEGETPELLDSVSGEIAREAEPERPVFGPVVDVDLQHAGSRGLKNRTNGEPPAGRGHEDVNSRIVVSSGREFTKAREAPASGIDTCRSRGACSSTRASSPGCRDGPPPLGDRIHAPSI